MGNATMDITCDLGESFGIYKIGRDDEVMPYITTAISAADSMASAHRDAQHRSPGQAAAPT